MISVWRLGDNEFGCRRTNMVEVGTERARRLFGYPQQAFCNKCWCWRGSEVFSELFSNAEGEAIIASIKERDPVPKGRELESPA